MKTHVCKMHEKYTYANTLIITKKQQEPKSLIRKTWNNWQTETLYFNKEGLLMHGLFYIKYESIVIKEHLVYGILSVI